VRRVPTVIMDSTDEKLLYTVPPEADRRPPNPGADPDLADAVRLDETGSLPTTHVPRIDRPADPTPDPSDASSVPDSAADD